VAAEGDWLLRFLAEFASMSDAERDAAIETLSPEDREALLALSEARASASNADLIEVLDAGHAGLDRLYEVTQPADLFAVINLAAKGHPRLVVEALFAAVVAHRGWAEGEPAQIVALREQWIWHVYERIAEAHEQVEGGEPKGADSTAEPGA
jgi:hypothetical protein